MDYIYGLFGLRFTTHTFTVCCTFGVGRSRDIWCYLPLPVFTLLPLPCDLFTFCVTLIYPLRVPRTLLAWCRLGGVRCCYALRLRVVDDGDLHAPILRCYALCVVPLRVKLPLCPVCLDGVLCLYDVDGDMLHTLLRICPTFGLHFTFIRTL